MGQLLRLLIGNRPQPSPVLYHRSFDLPAERCISHQPRSSVPHVRQTGTVARVTFFQLLDQSGDGSECFRVIRHIGIQPAQVNLVKVS